MYSIAGRHLAECEAVEIHPSVLEPYREAIKLRLAEMKGHYSPIAGPASLGSRRAMYMGPIKVVHDPIKGRKVVTSRAVRAGEVLLVEGPTVALTYNGSPGVSLQTVKWGYDAMKPSPHQVSWTVHRIMDDPSVGQCIHSLAPDSNVQGNNLGLTDEERLQVFHHPREIEVDLLARQLDRNAFGGAGSFSVYGLGSMISHSCKVNILSSTVESSENVS
jgi:hypothetical protein